MAAASEGVWSPFVELLRLVNAVLVHKDVGQLPELETALRRHKTNFINLLRNPVSDLRSSQWMGHDPTAKLYPNNLFMLNCVCIMLPFCHDQICHMICSVSS